MIRKRCVYKSAERVMEPQIDRHAGSRFTERPGTGLTQGGMSKLSREERETVIRAGACDDEWDLWTSDLKTVRRLERLGYQPTKDHQGGWSCRIPLHRLKVMHPERRKATGRPFKLKSCATGRDSEGQNTTGVPS